MVVVLRKVEFEQRALSASFLNGVHGIQAIGGLFQAFIRVVVRIRRGHSPRLRIPGINVGGAEGPARHVPVLHVIHRAEEHRFFTVGVEVRTVIPPDIQSPVRRCVSWRHTLQEVALLTISFNPGSFQTQVQNVGNLIAKGQCLQPRGVVIDIVNPAVADLIAGAVELIAGG